MKLDTHWTSGLATKEKAEMEQMLRSKPPTLKRLKDIVQKRLQEVETIKKADYQSPSWAYLQAHQNGFKQAMKEIEDLLSFL